MKCPLKAVESSVCHCKILHLQKYWHRSIMISQVIKCLTAKSLFQYLHFYDGMLLVVAKVMRGWTNVRGILHQIPNGGRWDPSDSIYPQFFLSPAPGAKVFSKVFSNIHSTAENKYSCRKLWKVCCLKPILEPTFKYLTSFVRTGHYLPWEIESEIEFSSTPEWVDYWKCTGLNK